MILYTISCLTSPYVFYPFIVQGIISILLVRYALSKCKPLDRISKETHSKYPAFERDDKSKWVNYKFYIFGFCFFFLRCIIALSGMLTCALIAKILLLSGGATSQGEVKYEQRKSAETLVRLVSRIFLFGLGILWITEEDVDVDYTEYLGNGYDKKDRVCTVVANHTSWFDIHYFMYSRYLPAFVSKEAVKHAPIVNLVGRYLGMMYINRQSDKANREKFIQALEQRQFEMEDGKEKVYLVIYPEGTTSNGKYLMEFKRGAFAANLPVKPVCIKYSGGHYRPTFESLKFLPFTILLLCNPINTAHVRHLPIFVPNDYLYENHKKLADSKPMIYAEAVRKIMADNSDLQVSDQTVKDKLEYLDVVYDQKKFT